jgi:hypothetical protein
MTMTGQSTFCIIKELNAAPCYAAYVLFSTKGLRTQMSSRRKSSHAEIYNAAAKTKNEGSIHISKQYVLYILTSTMDATTTVLTTNPY